MDVLSRLFGCKPECCAERANEGGDVVVASLPASAGMKLGGLPGPPEKLQPISRQEEVLARKGSELEDPDLHHRLSLNPAHDVGDESLLTRNTVTDDSEKAIVHSMVGGGNDRDVIVQQPSSKTADEIQVMVNAVGRNHNLKTVLNLDDNFCNEMVEMAWKEQVAPNVNIILQGDLDGDYFYIVQDGELDVIIHGVTVQTLYKGDSFGELALLYFAPRAATVRTTTHSTLWVVDRCHFKQILARAAEQHLMRYAKHLQAIECCEKLTKKVRIEVANALQETHFDYGNTVYTFGDRGDSFWLFFSCELAFMRGGKEVERVKGETHLPIILGEKALSESPQRKETVVVKSATATGMTMNRACFDLLMSKVKLERENKKKVKEGLPFERFGSSQYLTDAFKTSHTDNIRLKDIHVIAPLGVGAFGLVELVEHVPTQTMYALKTMSKGYIVKSGLQSSVLYEKNIQFMCDSPFIVKLIDTFNTSQTMCFLQEVILGGELMTYYTRNRLWGDTVHTKFYCAGAALAFEHMHGKQIIYRDLKPENVLINSAGQPQLTDMGLAKLSPGKTYTTCGALVSMSPEVIKCTGHNRGADWWTLGIMMFELMAKETPFNGTSPTEIYSRIFIGMDKVEFKTGMKGDCEQLIKSLCHQLVPRRLTMLPGGIDNFKRHDWYKGFDWGALQSESMAAPSKPDIKGKTDVSNFHKLIDAKIPMESNYVDEGNGWDKDFATST